MKSAKIKERELIIKLAKEGKACREIASLLAVSKSKASFWIVRYAETNSLEDKPKSGRPTKLTNERLSDISEKIKSKLKEQKNKAGFSSKEVLDILEEETGKRYTLRHARRLLHNMGFSLITPQVSHIKKDKNAQNKFREELKKNFRWNTQDFRS